jgi:hypothetical protein
VSVRQQCDAQCVFHESLHSLALRKNCMISARAVTLGMTYKELRRV